MSPAAALVHNLRNRLSKPTAYRLFDIQLKRRITLSPSLTRFVFGGSDVALMRTLAPDQRVKLLFPSANGEPSNLPKQGDWRAPLRDLSPERVPPMRSYTIRNLRLEAGELDIDFVLHGVTGPATRWATQAKAGAPLQIAAPNAAYTDDPGGYEWQPPQGMRKVLLIGDETALPAIAGILEELAHHPDTPQVQVFIEVPEESDCQNLVCGPNTKIHWLPRASLGKQHGDGMILAARELASLPPRRLQAKACAVLQELDLDNQRLWERASARHNEFYAWVAGESMAVMAIRRFFVHECGMDRKALTLMGYWKLGRSLG